MEGAASDAPRGGPKADGFGRAVDEVAAWLERYAALVAPASVLRARDGNTGVALGVTGAILYMHLAMAQLVIHVTESRWRNFFHAQLSGPLLATLVATAVMVAGAALERQGAGGLVALAGLIAACATVLPLSIYLLPEQIRPTELFRKMDTAAAWLRGAVRLPIRSVLRLPAIEVGAG